MEATVIAALSDLGPVGAVAIGIVYLFLRDRRGRRENGNPSPHTMHAEVLALLREMRDDVRTHNLGSETLRQRVEDIWHNRHG